MPRSPNNTDAPASPSVALAKDGPTTTRVRVRIRAPRFLFVTVPTGRSPRATLEAAAAKAQDHILLHATLAAK